MITKEYLKTLLQKAKEVTITFEKNDGSVRVMKATLDPDIVVFEKKTNRTKKPNENILPVWDVNKGEWRSVNVTKITKLEFELAAT